MSAGGGAAEPAVRVRAGTGGGVLFAVGGVPAGGVPWGAEPDGGVIAGGPRGDSAYRLAAPAGGGWMSARPIGIAVSVPRPAGFAAAYGPAVDAARARVYRGSIDGAHGMAFHVGGGLGVSAYHIVSASAPRYLLVRGDADPETIAVVGGSWASDIVIFRGPDPGGDAEFALAGADPDPGRAVLGSEGGVGPVLADAAEAQSSWRRKGRSGDIMEARVSGRKGMSGSPLIGDCGRVAGVVVAGWGWRAPVSSFVPAEAVAAVLDGVLADER